MIRRSAAEVLLAVQLEQAGIPFEREYLFHPERKWRASNMVEWAHGESRIAPHGCVSILRSTVPTSALRRPVLLAPMREPSMERSATAHPPMSTMRRGVRAPVVGAPVLLGGVPTVGRSRATPAYRWTGQGMGEGRPGRPAESGLEGRRRLVSGLPPSRRAQVRQAAPVLSLRHHRSTPHLRLGELDRELPGPRRLRPHVSIVPSAVRP